MRKKLSSDGCDCGSKKFKLDCGSAYGRVWQSLHLAGLELDFRFCVGAFVMNLSSVALTTFYIVYFVRKLYTGFTLNSI